MVTAPGSNSDPGPSANVGIWDAAESRSHAGAGCGSRSMGGCWPRITRVQSPHGHGSSAASVAPSRLRDVLAGSKYGVAGQRGSPAVAGQDPLPQLIGGHPSGRYLGERRQVLRTWLQALGPHRCQRRRDRVLPLGRLLQRFVLLTDTSTPSVLRWAPKPAATQPTPVAVLLLNPVVRVCASRMGSEENQIVCGG
jgi:hypothetical protein